MKRTWLLRHSLLGLIVLALSLAACTTPDGAGPPGSPPPDSEPPGQPPAEEEYSPGEIADTLEGFQEAAMRALSGRSFALIDGATDMLLGDLPEATAPGSLPRGVYSWNEEFYAWEFVEQNPNLVLLWEFVESGRHEAELTIDWGATTSGEFEGRTFEVPGSTVATIMVDGASFGGFSSRADWQVTERCGVILEPSSYTASGSIGDRNGEISLDNFTLEIPLAAGTASTSGKVSARTGSDSVSFAWNLSATGRVLRDSQTCHAEDMEVTSGSVDFEVAANQESLGFALGFGDLTLGRSGELTSVRISNGALTVNGAAAVTFDGTLDASDGFTGSNLFLTFANGERMTLARFLESSARNFAAAALRMGR